MIIKPMLACEVDLSKIKYPVICSPKLDGIRCLSVDGQAYTRSGKLVPNRHIQNCFKKAPSGLDGELMLATPADFSAVQAAVMSVDGEPKFHYIVFDRWDQPVTYTRRLGAIKYIKNIDWLYTIQSFMAHDEAELLDIEADLVSNGAEGVMIRDPNGIYKNGRSTVKEGYLMKLKRFIDAEAVVTGFVELQHNNNTAEKDVFGRTKRSDCKDGKVDADTLGALSVRALGAEFEIGTGFDAATRQHIWNNRDKYINKLVKFKYQNIGSKGRPRFPSFIGFRSELDTGE